MSRGQGGTLLNPRITGSSTATKGKFIVFEGIDGCGKTTQLKRLKYRMMSQGIHCIDTYEPSDFLVGTLARDTVKGGVVLEPETLALLFAADRFDHTTRRIIPSLRRGISVLCDRYYYSNMAYQGLLFGHARIMEINSDTMKKIRPDLVLFLDVPPEECAKRRAQNRFKDELFDDLETQRKVRESYFKAMHLLGPDENIEVISSSAGPDDVSALIWEKVAECFTEV